MRGVDTSPGSRTGGLTIWLARAFGTAPADRAPWRRGPRALLALVASLAALAALVTRSEASGGGGSEGRTFDYRLDGPEWVDPALLAVAAGLGMAAMALWAARHWMAVALALGLLPCLVTGGVLAVVAKHSAGRHSAAEVEAAARVPTQAGVRELLGSPAGHGTMTSPGGRTDCLVYVGEAVRRTGWNTHHMYCHRDGRIVARESW